MSIFQRVMTFEHFQHCENFVPSECMNPSECFDAFKHYDTHFIVTLYTILYILRTMSTLNILNNLKPDILGGVFLWAEAQFERDSQTLTNCGAPLT